MLPLMLSGIKIATAAMVKMSGFVIIYIYIVAVPVEPGPGEEIEPDEKSGSEANITAGYEHTGRIIPVPGEICRIPPRPIYV